MWQNHFFAALLWLLPPKFQVEPEYPVTTDSSCGGSVDFRIVGPQFSGFVEWLVTDYSNNKQNAPKTVKNYILKHYYRFVKDPNNNFKQKYEGISENFMVINVSHKPSNIEIPGKLPLTFFELIVDDLMQKVELHFDGIIVPIEMEKPFIYDLGSKQRIQPRITLLNGIFFNILSFSFVEVKPMQFMKCVIGGKNIGIIHVTKEMTLHDARLRIMDELDDIQPTFKFTKDGAPFSAKQEQTYKCLDIGESFELFVE